MAKRSRKQSPQRRLFLANKKIRAQVPGRLRKVVDDHGGVTAFARAHSVSPKYVYKWVSEGMVPNADSLIRFAQVSGVSPDWLLLGKGKPYFDGRKPTPTAKKAA